MSDVKKNEDKLKKFAAGMENFSVNSKSRKIMHLAKDDELDQALFSILYENPITVYMYCIHLFSNFI